MQDWSGLESLQQLDIALHRVDEGVEVAVRAGGLLQLPRQPGVGCGARGRERGPRQHHSALSAPRRALRPTNYCRLLRRRAGAAPPARRRATLPAPGVAGVSTGWPSLIRRDGGNGKVAAADFVLPAGVAFAGLGDWSVAQTKLLPANILTIQITGGQCNWVNRYLSSFLPSIGFRIRCTVHLPDFNNHLVDKLSVAGWSTLCELVSLDIVREISGDSSAATPA